MRCFLACRFPWKKLAPALAPELRGPIAYFLGIHYHRDLKRSADAETFWRTAQKDAGADMRLHRLAQEKLDELKAK